MTRDALEGEGPQRQPQRRLDRRLEEVAKAVGGGYCRLQMPLRLALGVRGTVAGRWLGALEGARGGTSPPSNATLGVTLLPFLTFQHKAWAHINRRPKPKRLTAHAKSRGTARRMATPPQGRSTRAHVWQHRKPARRHDGEAADILVLLLR